MIPQIRSRVLWIVMSGLVLLLASVHLMIGGLDQHEEKSQRLRFLPDGHFLRTASLGYRELTADVLWLQAIQVMGERKVSPEAGRWIYRLLDVVTTIDPKFTWAYEAGGIALCTLVVLPEESNRLLEKGMLHNPEEWKFPFLLSINYAFELGEDAKAAEAMALAAQLPGAPSNLGRLAANFFVSAKAPQQAIDLLSDLYEKTSDPGTKSLLGERLKRVAVERDLQLIEGSIARYRQSHGGLPSRLEDLTTSGILEKLPIEPYGGRYEYDPHSGTVRSSEISERMTLSMKRRRDSL
ncbi:conserved protein of unknown function [Nitrospira japonica]|uniref:Uncharacterized protein n=1 Tax=Nitrospira japonica TaxID=1325564 RepID=A0A1W1I0A1_9BACT|nr:hypothetical protein [Nitrospira japonica]SLM46430.1 conserved protein of unknown function [Nitrospira japonica]